ncbi:MAG: hypothetical protein PWQ57_3314 [Desulfovibrionales bacterium]|nr:hypothetical protein [Desulfovibrionales bacterium]
MLASEIFLLVSGKLQDLRNGTADRWPWERSPGVLSLVDLFNNAVNNIALNRPDATAVTESIRLQAGASQSIPDTATHGASKNALCLLDLVQNMGSDGATPGAPIFRVSRDAMSTFDWSAAGTTVYNFAYDKMTNPEIYWVSPAIKAGATVYVQATYSAVPTQITVPADAVPIPDTFSVPIMHWMLYEVFAGDNSDADFAKAQHHLTAFYQALGVKLKADLFFPVQVRQMEGK